jgi:hypothetical protein
MENGAILSEDGALGVDSGGSLEDIAGCKQARKLTGCILLICAEEADRGEDGYAAIGLSFAY